VAESLINDLGSTGQIFMYGSYEKRIINDLTGHVPDLARKLKPIIDLLVDLYPFVKEHYYHPDMKGSWSLKSVTACIAPEMSHEKLQEVTEGMAAQRAYLEITVPETNEIRRENLKNKLLAYCKLDTMSMVKIARLLRGH
jgi:predicted RecB family nuclease